MAAWDGQGKPPSEAAAVDWMIAQGIDRQTAEQVAEENALAELGAAARGVVAGARFVGETVTGTAKSQVSGGFDLGGFLREVVTGGGLGGGVREQASGEAATPGDMAREVATGGGVGGGVRELAADQPAPQPGPAPRGPWGTFGDAAAAVASGQLTPEQAAQIAASEGGDDILAQFGPIPGMGSDRGAPLVPVGGEEFRSREQSNVGGFAWGDRPDVGDLRKARYYEDDLLTPYKWSREDRAEIQKLMRRIGLYEVYGEGKIDLGSWGERDMAAYSSLLVAANVEGRTWRDQLRTWTVNPPSDVKQARRERERQKPNKPTYRVTNPADIQQAVRSTSRDLLGTGAPAEVVSQAVGDVQAAEIAAQRAVSRDQKRGGGGTIVQPPSVGTTAEYAIREAMPEQVDGYAFLGQLNNFISMLGGRT